MVFPFLLEICDILPLCYTEQGKLNKLLSEDDQDGQKRDATNHS
jgi:hypothetical protein